MAKKNINEAIANVRSVARTFQAVIDLADALGEMQSIEQVANEIHVRHVAAQKDLDKVNQELTYSKNNLADTRAAAQVVTREANAAKDDIVGKAIAQAKETTDKADAMKRSADQYAKDVQGAANAKLRDLEALITLRDNELTEINIKLEKARAKMAEMLR